MSNLKTEAWSLEEISACLTKKKLDGKKIVIPIFQRGKRWNTKDKNSFIDSLKKNYPIGSLLFFKKRMNNQDIYILIDGLQRSSTIKEYLKNPTSFFSIEQIDQNVWDSIKKLLKENISNENIDILDIQKILNQYVCGLPSFDKFDPFDLGDMIREIIPEFDVNLTRLLHINIKSSIEQLKTNYNELAKVEIPVIVYTGPEETLPEIFERINKEGHPLDDYDIYSASWPEDKFHINNDKVISHILKKYDMLNDDDFYIDNYDRDNLRINKNVSVFEYIFGFSKWITTEFDILNFKTNLKDDVANPFGFELLNACFNSSHNQIKELYKPILKIHDKIDKLEEALIDSIKYVEGCIAPIIRFKGNTRETSCRILHSQFQIMSLISFVFRCRYNVENFEILDSWVEDEKTISSNIIKYYIYDVLNKTWNDGGTNKIHTANIEKRYLNSISKGQFLSALDSLNEERLNRHENKVVKGIDDKDYAILNAIHMNTFTASDQLSTTKFDVEHIATKNLMKQLIKVTKGEGLPISHIANLCYLPENANRVKQDNTFYQDNDWLEKTGYTLYEIETKYSFTTRQDLEWADIEYKENDFDFLKEVYLEFLGKRYRIIKDKFLLALGYDLEENDKNTSTNINLSEDNYYRLTKIGQLVKESFKQLTDNSLLTSVDINNLQNADYSSKYLGCAFPVLVDSKEKTFDSLGRSRYYSEEINYKGTKYYLCSEWFENDRKKFVPWIKAKLSNSKQ